jgi:integrase/recombinase XerC
MKNFFLQKSDEFLSYLENIRGYSPLTIKTYRLNLKEALSYVDIEFVDKVYKINLIPYRIKLTSLKKKSIYKKITIFRSFSSYLSENGITIKLIGDDSIKVVQTLPKPISDTHINEALSRCDNDERVIIYLFYTLGVRISELISLKLEDISDKWVSVKGKGGKIRQIPVLDELHTLIDEFVDRSGAQVYLFEKNGKAMSENQLRYLVNKIFKKIGIKASPHQLRHSFASTLLNSGARVNDVSELLGHSSLTTTQIYTKLSASSKMRNYKDAHPLCGSKDESV